jgi:hypothetical protein
MVERSEARTVFDSSNTGIVGSSRHGCVSFFCVVLSCVGSDLATGKSPVQGVLPNVQKQIQILNQKMPEGVIRIY